jgi:hypothetical protein
VSARLVPRAAGRTNPSADASLSNVRTAGETDEHGQPKVRSLAPDRVRASSFPWRWAIVLWSCHTSQGPSRLGI